jgi:hypothetical protein
MLKAADYGILFNAGLCSAVVSGVNVPLRPSDRAARPANLATNQAKGMVSPTIMCCASRAGCHESGLSVLDGGSLNQTLWRCMSEDNLSVLSDSS